MYVELCKDPIIEEDTKRADVRLLRIGQMVRLQPLQRGEVIWKERRVIQKLTSISYLIKKKDVTTVRQNRLFMKPSNRATYHLIDNSKNTLIRNTMVLWSIPAIPSEPALSEASSPKHNAPQVERSDLDKTQTRNTNVKRPLVETGRTTRLGRLVKKPKRYL